MRESQGVELATTIRYGASWRLGLVGVGVAVIPAALLLTVGDGQQPWSTILWAVAAALLGINLLGLVRLPGVILSQNGILIRRLLGSDNATWHQVRDLALEDVDFGDSPMGRLSVPYLALTVRREGGSSKRIRFRVAQQRRALGEIRDYAEQHGVSWSPVAPGERVDGSTEWRPLAFLITGLAGGILIMSALGICRYGIDCGDGWLR